MELFQKCRYRVYKLKKRCAVYIHWVYRLSICTCTCASFVCCLPVDVRARILSVCFVLPVVPFLFLFLFLLLYFVTGTALVPVLLLQVVLLLLYCTGTCRLKPIVFYCSYVSRVRCQSVSLFHMYIYIYILSSHVLRWIWFSWELFFTTDIMVVRLSNVVKIVYLLLELCDIVGIPFVSVDSLFVHWWAHALANPINMCRYTWAVACGDQCRSFSLCACHHWCFVTVREHKNTPFISH